MRLWDDAIEAMRAEAREATAATLPAMAASLGVGGPAPADPAARVRWMREGFAKSYAARFRNINVINTGRKA
jgi:hypothetical protein